MPCRDYDPAEEHANRVAMKARLDLVTRLLCETLTELDKNSDFSHVSPEAQAWYEQHKEADRLEQMKEEKARKMRRIQLRKEIEERQAELVRLGQSEDKRPARCRNRLRDEGKAYPKSGCEVCSTGGMTGCPWED